MRYKNNNDFLSFKNKPKSAPRICISFPSKLHKKNIETTSIFLSIEIRLKKERQKDINLLLIKITSNKVRWNEVDFCSSKLLQTKHFEMMSIFCPSILRRRKYIKMTSIFHSSKLCQIKYVKTTSIFDPSKLYLRSTLKWRGNLSIFSAWCIGVISPSNRRRFDVVCPLG